MRTNREKAGDSVELAQFIFEGRLIVCHFGKFCVGSFIMSDFDMHLYAVCCVCVNLDGIVWHLLFL